MKEKQSLFKKTKIYNIQPLEIIISQLNIRIPQKFITFNKDYGKVKIPQLNISKDLKTNLIKKTQFYNIQQPKSKRLRNKNLNQHIKF